MSTTSSASGPDSTTKGGSGSAQNNEGIGITSFLTSIAVAVAIFGVQTFIFLLLRNKLARIL
jgi:hypothetical protein